MTQRDSANDRPEEASRRHSILIVEDDAASRGLLEDFVTMLGHRPIGTENGQSAMALLEREQPDLILLDVMMPAMDGLEVLTRLKGDEELRHLPVIMISAVDETDSVLQCIEKGAEDYLVKPFQPSLLRARIGACLEKKELRDRERELLRNLQSSYASLKEAEGARDALAHMIVHDLNTPLANVLGYSELILMGLEQETLAKEKLAGDLRAIQSSASQMSALIRGILDVARLESGEMPVTLQPVDVASLAAGVCERMTPQAAGFGMTVSCKSVDDQVMARADRDLLSRVLQNLIVNAFRHGGGASELIVRIGREEDSVLVSVHDNGTGIPSNAQDRIFEKFFQAQERTLGRKYGVGLGLTFCKLAVEAQGGRIWVDSTEGEGSTFSVLLEAVPG